MSDETTINLESFLSQNDMDSPPKAEVDDASLQTSMDRNKESLKVKLLLRRPLNQLVDQGIMPTLKGSPGLYEQSKKLERAKMGDFLKRKIQGRPDRQILIQQHILEDTTVSPSLQDKQRLLKKARLADDLNDRLSHRPGPLELIKGNILIADERLAQAVREGQIQFKATCEGEPVKHPPPRFTIEEESSSDDALPSPPQDSSTDQSMTSFPSIEGSSEITSPSNISTSNSSPQSVFLFSPTASIISSPPSVPSSLLISTVSNQFTPAASLSSTPSTISIPLSSASISFAPLQQPLFSTAAITTPIATVSTISPASIVSTVQSNKYQSTQSSQSPVTICNNVIREVGSSGKNRKKTKSKSQPKTRTIKFHEYKGPPNAQKIQSLLSSSSCSSETSYELLLKQQQLFLQWQLEWQQKYPQIILPASQKSNLDQLKGSNCLNSNMSHMINCQSQFNLTTLNRNQNCNVDRSNTNNSNSGSIANYNNMQANSSLISGKMVSKLEDMKVSDLKVELKKRNLPVSGSKPQLIERLKPFAESILSGVSAVNSGDVSNSLMMSNVNQQKVETTDTTPMSPMESISNNVNTNSNSSSGSGVNLDSNKVPESPPTTPMEIDGLANVVMDVSDNSDDVVLQKKSDEMQAKCQKTQLQFHINRPVIQNSSNKPVTIPLTLASPQIHILPTNQNINGTLPDAKTLQRQIIQQHLQHKIQQQVEQQAQCPVQQNIAAVLSPGNASAAVKASLAAFLQNQAAQQSSHQKQIPFQQPATIQQFPTLVTTQVLDTKAFPTFQQVLLCPGPITNFHQPQVVEIKQQRTNSLPNGISVSKQVSQRTSSLPNFSTVNEIKNEKASKSPPPTASSFVMKPPPGYEEATKQISKQVKDKKNSSVKSQAVDDVLEILIKNGELPESAAQEPATPTTPEKSSNFCTHPAFGSVVNKSETKQSQPPSQPELNLDLDFTLDLQELADSMDLHSFGDQNNNKSTANKGSRIKTEEKHENTCSIPSGDLSLSEFIDFQESAINMDDADWLAEIVMPSNNNGSNLNEAYSSPPPANFNAGNNSYLSRGHTSNLTNNAMSSTSLSLSSISSSPPPSSLSSSASTPPSSTSSLSVGSSSLAYTKSEHDPLLPNNMVGTSQGDPLIELFFDETDFKAPSELGNLMWDKIDFAT